VVPAMIQLTTKKVEQTNDAQDRTGYCRLNESVRRLAAVSLQLGRLEPPTALLTFNPYVAFRNNHC
jgi:hypothetical protein